MVDPSWAEAVMKGGGLSVATWLAWQCLQLVRSMHEALTALTKQALDVLPVCAASNQALATAIERLADSRPLRSVS